MAIEVEAGYKVKESKEESEKILLDMNKYRIIFLFRCGQNPNLILC